MESWTRRELLAASALGAAGLAGRKGLAAVQADGQEKQKPKSPAPASESIVLGFIGVGGMGSGLLNTFKHFPDMRIAAVCDVYEPHARRAQSAADGKPEVYHDFRKLLDRKDLDAVVIATPDHWHAIPTILACQAGKDVYCEKPLTHRIVEGRAVVTRGRTAQPRHSDGQPDPRGRELSPRGRDRPLRHSGHDQQDPSLDGRRPQRPGQARRL